MRFPDVLAPLLFAAVLHAQFRAGTQEVRVDALVLDKKGAFQGNLTRDNFKISEDGKEQKITSFSLESAGTPGHSNPHFIALVFDTSDVGIRDQMLAFVDRFASPDLYLAVYSRVNGEVKLQQGFTTDGGRIRVALKSMPPAPSPHEQHQQGRDPIPDSLKGVSSVAMSLREIRGRKAMVLFSIGIFGHRGPPVQMEDGSYLRAGAGPMAALIRKTIDDCNSANVSVYAFEPGPNEHRTDSYGEYYDPPQDASQDVGGANDFFHDVALATGGKYSPPGTYELASFLGEITAEQSDYYLLGYTPSAESVDKPCHKLKVKVDRSGLDVEARDSYCMSGGPPAESLKGAQRALEARAARGVPGNIQAAMQVSWFYSKANLALVDIAMDLEPGNTKVKGREHGEFNLVGVVYHDDGAVVTRFGDAAELDPPYHYSRQFELAPGRYLIRMVAGSGDQAFGSVEKTVEIDPWGGKELSASGIALSMQDYALTGVTAELDSSVLEGPRRLASRGRAIVPMGGDRVPVGQNGLFYFEIYNPGFAETPKMQIRILDRTTNVETMNSGLLDTGIYALAGNPVIPIALNLPVSNLPAGSYTLEVRAKHADGRDAIVRTADFEVK
jgi:VWFA-related protein